MPFSARKAFKGSVDVKHSPVWFPPIAVATRTPLYRFHDLKGTDRETIPPSLLILCTLTKHEHSSKPLESKDVGGQAASKIKTTARVIWDFNSSQWARPQIFNCVVGQGGLRNPISHSQVWKPNGERLGGHPSRCGLLLSPASNAGFWWLGGGGWAREGGGVRVWLM